VKTNPIQSQTKPILAFSYGVLTDSVLSSVDCVWILDVHHSHLLQRIKDGIEYLLGSDDFDETHGFYHVSSPMAVTASTTF